QTCALPISDIDAEDEEPAEVGDDPGASRGEALCDRSGEQDQEQHEDQRARCRNEKDYGIGSQPQSPCKPFHRPIRSVANASCSVATATPHSETPPMHQMFQTLVAPPAPDAHIPRGGDGASSFDHARAQLRVASSFSASQVLMRD